MTGREPHREAALRPGDYVLGGILDRHAAERPDKVAFLFANGESWTYAELQQRVRATALGLQQLGVGSSDRVLSWQENGPEAVKLWFALNYIGAVYVPINTAYRGRLLEHVVANSGASLMVANAKFADRLADIGTANLKDVVVTEGSMPPTEGLRRIPGTELFLDAGTPDAGSITAPMPWDTQSVIYTSGTTGPSKGVLSSYMHLYSSAMGFSFLTEDDRALVTTPLFHASGTGGVYRAFVRGGSVALANSFKTDEFWDTVRRTQSTFAGMIGAMAAFLLKRPPEDGDRSHGLRHVTIVPVTEDTLPFAGRFGVDVYSTFNMTEISCPIFTAANPQAAGSSGRVRAGYEARIVDANDIEVPAGGAGELVLRTAQPWTFSHGYLNDAEATAKAWRNGWFHTGDLFRQNEDGEYFFIDRLKDSIRRRGENISSVELEAELLGFAGVREAAAVGVPSEFGEEDVLAVLAPQAGVTLEPQALVDFLLPRVPRYMIPRFIRIVPELPKTPTHKVEKHALRHEGVTADTWERPLPRRGA